MKSNLILGIAAIIFVLGIGTYFMVSPIAIDTSPKDIFVPNASPSAKTSPVDQIPQAVKEQPQTENATITPDTSAPTPATPTIPAESSGYTVAQVVTHSTAQDCWTIINRSVYDISAYVPKHPGGVANITKICGKDGTKLFEMQHGGKQKQAAILESYLLGTLK